MANTRELSQLASVISVADETRNVGIGTTTPTSKLHVSGDVRVSGVVTATSFSGDGSQLIGISASSSSQWVTTASGIHTLSNVGIGTTNPTSKLHVSGDVRVSGVVTATTFVGALTGTASNVTTNANLTGHVTSVGNAAVLGSFTSLQLLTALTDETGSGANVFATSPTLVTPVLGTPSSGTLTNCTGLPISTGVSGLAANIATFLAIPSSANLAAALTDETGTGSAVFATSPTLVTPVLGSATATSIVVGSGVTINSSGINASGIITASQLSTGASGTGINISTDTISGPATLTIDPAAVGDNTGAVRIKGDLYVDGDQFIVNSITIELADFNVGIATTVGTNALLDGAGIGIGSIGIRKTIQWANSSNSLESSESFNLNIGKTYKINGTDVLSNTTLGSGVTNSSLTSVGTLGQLNVTGVSTFTNGPILVGTATSTGTTDQRLQVTGGAYVSGNLGIGNTLPTSKLVVQGDGRFVSSGQGDVTITHSNLVSTIKGTSTVQLALGANNNEVIRINNSSQVGIGTTTPTSKLHVVGDVTATTFVGALTGTATSTTNIPNLTGAITSVNTTTSLGSFTSAQLATALTDETGSGANVFATSPTLVTPVLGAATATSIVVSSGSTFTNGPILVGTATSTGTASQRLQVTGGAYVSGSFGIGTTNPTSKLHVIGDARITGVVTATTFVGALTGTASSTTNIPNLTGDITSVNSVTSIAAGVIVDADINASAGIVDTKLATISTAGKVSNSATTATNANTASAIVARDASGNFSAGTITANLTGTASNVTTNANLTGHVTSVGNAAVLGSFTSAQLATALTDETGTGAAVFATSPTLVTPVLGTPQSGTLTSCTGLPISGLTASTSTALGVGSIELGHASDTTLTRVSAGLVAIEGVNIVTTSATQTLTNKTLTSPTLTTPVLGTPSSGTLSNCTVDGTFSVGYKKIPPVGTKTSSYTLVAGDVGKFVELESGGSVVIPASVFSAGDAIMIFNNTAASITCTCSAVTTVYKGGTNADIGTFSVTTRGVANILFISATVAVVTGNLS